MIAVMLLMFVGGIALTQVVSDPKQVTLRWLRLGGVIALALLGVTWTVAANSGGGPLELEQVIDLLLPALLVMGQLIAVQLGRHVLQRGLALVVIPAALDYTAAFFVDYLPTPTPSHQFWLSSFLLWFLQVAVPLAVSNLVAAGLLGGFLMTMLLGHAYITAGGEMTQKPFMRLVRMLAILLLLRLVFSVLFGLWPWWAGQEAVVTNRVWTMMMITTRYLVGLVVPAVFTYMIYDCGKRRANQSATGILYVAGVLVIIGEGAALALLGSTGRVF